MTSNSNSGPALPAQTGGDMVCVLDTGHRCVAANGSFLAAFGLDEGSPPDGAVQAGVAALVDVAAGDDPVGDGACSQRWWDFPSLGFRFVRVRLESERDESGTVRGTMVWVRDLTDARLAQEALEESEQRFDDFAEVVADWLWELDEGLRFVYLSARFEKVMGLSRDEVLGRRRIELFPGEDHAAAATRNHHLDLQQRRPFDAYPFARVLEDGSKRLMQMSGRPVFDGQGRFRGYRGVTRDATDTRQMEDRVAHLSTRDPLTDLVNRRELLQRLQRVIETACADGSEHGLCYVDVDRFRIINDHCGHAAGDQLLSDLAEVLGEQVRRRDTLARVGGNAFAILMEHCSLTRVEGVAEAVRRAVGEYRLVRRDDEVSAAVTIGIVAIDSNSRSVDKVLRAADRACYAAKSAGGNRTLVYGKPDRQASRERRGKDLAPAD